MGGGGRALVGQIHSLLIQLSAMEDLVYTRGDLLKNFPTSFSRAALEDHFSSEYVKVIGCQPELALIQSIARQFRTLWKVLKNKDRVLTTPRGQAFLSLKLPVKKEMEKENKKNANWSSFRKCFGVKEQGQQRSQRAPFSENIYEGLCT